MLAKKKMSLKRVYNGNERNTRKKDEKETLAFFFKRFDMNYYVC